MKAHESRPRLVDWVVTPPFLVAFGLVLLVFDPLQRIARLFGQRPQELVAGALQVTLVWVFRLCGTRIEIERTPELEAGTSYIVVANHQSMFDIPIAGALLFSNFPKYVSKRELARWIPSISYNLRRGGHALIDRGDRDQATRAIALLGARARERGVSVLLYPEGTRARHGELGRFKPAGFLALLEAAPELPLVPLVIDGSWRLLRFNLWPARFGTRIRVHLGTPIARRDGEDRLALLEQLRSQMQKRLDHWRAGTETDPS